MIRNAYVLKTEIRVWISFEGFQALPGCQLANAVCDGKRLLNESVYVYFWTFIHKNLPPIDLLMHSYNHSPGTNT